MHRFYELQLQRQVLWTSGIIKELILSCLVYYERELLLSISPCVESKVLRSDKKIVSLRYIRISTLWFSSFYILVIVS